VNRWAVAMAYLTDVFAARTLVSLGLSTQGDAEFSTSEGIPLPKTE
ncbi:MAG: NAD(P)/FAD-dependent oxidoreductase, partial [Mycobacterium sp.]